jgi:hypothetical protein
MSVIASAPAAPRFVTVPDVRHAFAGRRPNGLEGAIIHFDAGRTRSTTAPADPDWGARSTLKMGTLGGFAYAAIGRGGTIYLPANMDWESCGAHAGRSKCPVTGRTGISRFYVGFEINSPGWVCPTADPDLYVPWFDAVRDARGEVVMDKAGRASVRSSKGELYSRDQLRIVAANRANIRKGAYVPFTSAQMEALVAALFWLKERFPKTFRLDRVFGHDEVALPAGRKLDPGGCLGWEGQEALTMADFRAHLARRWAEQHGP